MKAENALHCGDNLAVLRKSIASESVDLVYLDPPFNSQASYNLLFKERNGERSAAQAAAFEDTWAWGDEAAKAYHELVQQGPLGVAELLKAFFSYLRNSDMMAYLAMMAPRLVELHRCLKPTGSLYLHCDPTASHYLKLLLDTLFGPANFRNEIIWRRTGAHNSARRYGPIHDVILFYTKSDTYTWNPAFRPYLRGYVEDYFNRKDGERRYRSQTLTGSGTRDGASGQPWRGYDPTPKGRHWAFPRALVDELGLAPEAPLHDKLEALAERGLLAPSDVDGLPEYRQYLDAGKGVALQDLWTYQPYTRGCLVGTKAAIDEDVKWLSKRGGRERLPFPTQKPKGLLARIIAASSNPGDVVLDPFCGCGTCVVMAEHLKRAWIGIDITHLAITQVRKRLKEEMDYHREQPLPVVVEGLPEDLESARALAREDKHKFQIWVLSELEARPTRNGRGPDGGADGFIYFRDSAEPGKYGTVVVQVKGGENVGVRDVRELMGVLTSRGADIAVLVLFPAPTAAMKATAAAAGFYVSKVFEGHGFARVQFLTVADLLRGDRPDYPRLDPEATMRRAARQPRAVDQRVLF